MSGIKLGDRLVILGGSDTALAAALSAKVGLTGRACLVVEGDAERQRTAADVEQEGVPVESFAAPFTALPFEPGSFDVAILRQTLPSSPAESRGRIVAETSRVVRPGGRVVVIDDGRRGGNGAEAASLLDGAGLRGARILAEREGLVFVEAVKPNLSS